MNAQFTLKTHSKAALLALAATLLSAEAAAQGGPPKPRVQIIFDTSTSMKVGPNDPFNNVVEMLDPGGDYTPLNPPSNGGPCVSKFCIAKDVVYNTLPQYATEARIGITSYYQFIAKSTSANTQQTKCYYDKMWIGGYFGPETQFTTPWDLNPGDAVGVWSAAEVFPAGAGSPGALGTLAGVNRCSDPATGANRHFVKKTAVAAGVTYNCAMFSYDTATNASPAVPLTLPAVAPSGNGGAVACYSAGWAPGVGQPPIVYQSKGAPVVQNQSGAVPSVGGMYTIQHIGPAGLVCPPATMMSAGLPVMGAPSTVLNGPISIGAGLNEWEGIGANECNGVPCNLFSANSAFVQQNAQQFWLSLQPSPFQPAVGPGNLISQTDDYGAAVNGTPVRQNGVVCVGGGGGAPAPTYTTYNSGEVWSSFGHSPGGVLAGAGFPATAAVDTTPNEPDPACTANQPCDFKLMSQTPVVPLWGPFTPINYDVPAAGAGENIVVAPNLTNGGSHYLRTGVCGAMPLLTSAAIGDANKWLVAPPGCGIGRSRCDMVPVMPNITLANGCTAQTMYGQASDVPAACVGLDGVVNNYTPSSTGANTNYTITLPLGSTNATCTALKNTYRSGPEGPTSQCPATCGSGAYAQTPCQCWANNAASGVGAPITSSAYYGGAAGLSNNRTTPPPMFSGAPSSTIDITPEATCSSSTGAAGCAWDTSNPCTMGQFETSNAAMCGAGPTPCTVSGRGLKAYGPPIGEVQPMKCLYVRQQFDWSKNTVSCTLTVRSRTFDPDNTTMNVCRYDMKQWSISTLDPLRVDCVYRAPTARHNYTVIGDRWCEYFRMRTQYQAPYFNYTYQWKTKGGELVSRRSGGNDSTASWVLASEHNEPPVMGSTLCATAYNDVTGFSGGECKPIIANCDGNANQECRLRWGAPINAGAGSGRYSLSLNKDSRGCLAPDYGAATDPWHVATPAGAAIMSAVAAFPNTPGTFQGSGSNVGPALIPATSPPAATACQQNGIPSGDAFALFSDWYEPGVGNGAGPTVATLGPAQAGYSYTAWNNQPTKESGWGAKDDGDGTLFPAGVPTGSQIFVPIPDDGAASNAAAIRQALSECVPPGASAVPATPGYVDPATLAWSAQGMCMASGYFHNGGATTYHAGNTPILDFTPLKGSLESAYKYLSDVRDTDTDSECREYFVVLATDGIENTPAGFTDPSVVSSITQMKAHIPLLAPTNTQGIRTYVIAIGSNLSANVPQLNAMAAAGGTGTAFTASSQAQLQVALSSVLNQITSGTFSRSKPAISTDGTRVYASHFVRGIGATASPEWRGYLEAYTINPSTGALTQQWEYADKLNAQVDAARVIKTDIAGVEQLFSTGNPTLLARVASDPGYGALTGAPYNLTPTKVVDFVRNTNLPASLPAPYLSAAASPPLRISRAGAIEHSSAVVVSKSSFASDWGGSTTAQRAAYTAWQATTATRPTRVIFGSSDGLLRGVVDRSADPGCLIAETDPTCSNGTEAWGYVPGDLVPLLYKTMQTNRKNVDNTLAVTDVCGTIGGAFPALTSTDAATCSSAEWFTVGVGSLRQGGRSMFALKLNDLGGSDWIWNYTHARLGETWSIPAMGRVRLGSEDHWATIFGGGLDCSPTCGAGDAMYVLDALTGVPMRLWTGVGGSGDQFPARPAIFRRPLDPFLNSAVEPTVNGNMYVMRFENPAGARLNNSLQWTPRTFFRPKAAADRKNVNGVDTPIMTVNMVAGTPPTYTLVPVSTGDVTLPLTVATLPPMYNRPKVATIYDGSGNTADYYVGTGDASSPSVPVAAAATNFFYAIHDRNVQGANDDGVPLWVFRFPNTNEQVISEPVVSTGDIVIATFIPPASASACALAGDVVLYSFNPKTGALVPSLVIPSFMPGAGAKTGVLRLANVGIASDLLQIGKSLTFNTSQGGLQQVGHEPPLKGGDIRSFRRVR